MALQEDEKNGVLKKIIDTMLVGIDADELETYELSEICQYSLQRVDQMDSINEARSLYIELSERWPIFALILDEEENKEHKRGEEELSQSAATLIQHGKIDDALSLVKKATQ